MWKLRNFTLKSENYVKSISRNIADFLFASNDSLPMSAQWKLRNFSACHSFFSNLLSNQRFTIELYCKSMDEKKNCVQGI